MSIKCYKGNVFTHDGQSTVTDFIKEIEQCDKLTAALKQAVNFTVYSGFHGFPKNDPLGQQGGFCKAFTQTENTQVNVAAEEMGKLFNVNIEVKVINSKDELNQLNISDLMTQGNVFFTWCDSDAYINTLMGLTMPAAQ